MLADVKIEFWTVAPPATTSYTVVESGEKAITRNMSAVLGQFRLFSSFKITAFSTMIFIHIFCIFAAGLLAGRDACNPPLDSGCVPMRGIDVPKPTCTVLRKERHLMVSFFNCENAHTHYLI